MGSITKNYLAQEIIQEITERAFGKGTMESFQELEGGFCNAVYRICLKDKREAILKVAPADHIRLMSCETEMMRTEVGAMRLAEENHIKGVPAVYAFDDSRTLCNGAYLLMEKKEGISLMDAKQTMDEAQKDAADRKVGGLLREINSIKGKKLGISVCQSCNMKCGLTLFII